jgi:HK97 family phage major capsid protein/HK97 family phage prohead protease
MPITEIKKETRIFRRFIENAEIVVRKTNGQTGMTFSASSETPVDRWYGTEVLSHKPSAVRLDRANGGAMPLLFNHDINDPIGMITGARIEKGRLMVDASPFSTDRAAEVQAMINGGLKNVSLMYKSYVIEENVETETFTVTDWEPFEVSIVTVPADPSVGIGRSAEAEYEVRMIRASNGAEKPILKEGQQMTKEEEQATEAAKVKAVAEETDRKAALEVRSESRPNAVELEKNRKRGIENLCKANKLDDRYRDMWIGQGLSLDQVSDDLLQILEERGKSNPQPVTKIGLTDQETQRFSLRRAILACIDKDWSKAGFEMECSRSIAAKLGKLPEPSKFYIPFEVMEGPNSGRFQKRDVTVATAGQGGYLVQTQNIGFIEVLRNRSVAFRMGARRLSGLQGSVTVPRQSAAATAYWLANEATSITESQQTFVQMALSPKNVGAYTEISRQLLLQASPGAEGIVSDDLGQVVAVAVDLAVLNGSGASGQPTGIIGTSGIGGVTGTSIAYAGILEFQTDVAGANVVPASGGYVTTPTIAALLMGRQRFSSTDTPLWTGNVWDGMVSGFPGMASNQMPAGDILFGDWQEVVVGEWGVLEIEVNPYANFPAGIVGVRAIYSMDVGVRRPFAFSLATSVT